MDIKANEIEALTEETLGQVSGGFREDNSKLPTAGKNIKCPSCGASAAESFSGTALSDPKTGSVEYHCKHCGTSFICYENSVILKDKWINLCKQKGYSYPFV